MPTIVSGTSSQPGQFWAGRSSIHCACPPISVAAPTLSMVISGITTMACRARKHASWTGPRARTGRRSAGQNRSQIPVPTTRATSSGAASSARPAASTSPKRPCLSNSATATHTTRAVNPASTNEPGHSRRHQRSAVAPGRTWICPASILDSSTPLSPRAYRYSASTGLYQPLRLPLLLSKDGARYGGYRMTTLAPDRAGPAAGPTAGPAAVPAARPQPPGRAQEPAAGPARSAGSLPNDSGTRAWLRRKAVAAWMNVLIAATVAITVVAAGVAAGRTWPGPGTWGISALKLFALWCLAFLPGWLYVRFLDLRAKALWSEYVLNLHRLGWDLPWHLPMPPVASGFYQRWEAGTHGRPADNIYRQKFEAYYGRQITSSGPDENYSVRSESLFPVFLATAVLAVGWAAVLWDTRFVTHPSGPWDVLKYGFLGAYAFVTSMLIRRFFQSDLRPSAYAAAVFRIMLVLLTVTVLHQVIGGARLAGSHAELAAAFVIGFFPLVGLQALQRVTSKLLRRFVPPITSEYPLDQLDGFNLWYEARLTEEGVEDMQNLATMNLVDVILHTRVPPGRLVDWTDQAFLLIHLEHANRDGLAGARQPQSCPAAELVAEPGPQARVKLRRVGIRTATDLLKAFSAEQVQPPGSLPKRHFVKPPHAELLPLPKEQLRLLVAVLG